jgi:hypothetical protein
MSTAQGDISLLNDPVAQKLLQAPIPAQLAYIWTDGSPRVLPIGFHWDGQQIVLGTPPNSPKMKALKNGTKVALTINTYEFPFKTLYIRGSVSITKSDDIVPEYALMAQRSLGKEGSEAWLAQVKPMLPAMNGMARLAITPEWVGIHDFEQRFPSAIEAAIAASMASA